MHSFTKMTSGLTRGVEHKGNEMVLLS